LAALHTWSQTLAEHIHLHVLVTAAGLTDDGGWQAAKKSCLLPRRVLMEVFRGKLRAELLRLLKRGELVLPPETSAAQLRGLLNKLVRVAWNVKILERYEHGRGVATYLARYLKGGPLPNQRLLDCRDGVVRFHYRDNRDVDQDSGRGRRKVLALPAAQFLARLLEHVPPKGLQTVRGYGLYANNQRARLAAARRQVGQGPLPAAAPPLTWQAFCARLGHPEAGHCPVCGAALERQEVLPRGRSPPDRQLTLVELKATG
jgi:hypothetical protein